MSKLTKELEGKLEAKEQRIYNLETDIEILEGKLSNAEKKIDKQIVEIQKGKSRYSDIYSAVVNKFLAENSNIESGEFTVTFDGKRWNWRKTAEKNLKIIYKEKE